MDVGEKVLVLGATGNIGSVVCRKLSSVGVPIRAATRDDTTGTFHAVSSPHY